MSEQMLFRCVREDDLAAVYRLAEAAGPGMTTLPADTKLLSRRIRFALDSFARTITTPENEYYMFVLEDPATGTVVGTSAIEAALGYHTPFYSYKIIRHTRVCPSLDIRTDHALLELVNNYQGSSEICTLFLDPAFRRDGNGMLLSRSRFMFIANNPSRFADRIIAEMRGVLNDKGNSPFWKAIGAHFFHMSFTRADRLTMSTDKQFIADLMPRQPIYIDLLPARARDVIGKPHKSTMPAMKILQNEGFRYEEYIDIFDGGPAIEAFVNQINTIKNSIVLPARIKSGKIKSAQYLVTNHQLDFRATIAPVSFTSTHCIIDQKTAALLQVQNNDLIRTISCRKTWSQHELHQ